MLYRERCLDWLNSLLCASCLSYPTPDLSINHAVGKKRHQLNWREGWTRGKWEGEEDGQSPTRDGRCSPLLHFVRNPIKHFTASVLRDGETQFLSQALIKKSMKVNVLILWRLKLPLYAHILGFSPKNLDCNMRRDRVRVSVSVFPVLDPTCLKQRLGPAVCPRVLSWILYYSYIYFLPLTRGQVGVATGLAWHSRRPFP